MGKDIVYSLDHLYTSIMWLRSNNPNITVEHSLQLLLPSPNLLIPLPQRCTLQSIMTQITLAKISDRYANKL